MDPEPLERLPLVELIVEERLRSSLAPWRDHPSVASLNRALAMPA